MNNLIRNVNKAYEYFYNFIQIPHKMANILRIACRFRLEHLFYNRNNQMKTINTNTDNAYRKRIAFIVHAHRKALK